jgi:Tfp pilus assembly protein PilF
MRAPGATLALGVLARDAGDQTTAEQALRLAAAGDEPRAAVALSALLLRSDRAAEARDVLRPAVSACVDPEAHQAMAAVLWQIGDVRAAFEEHRRAIELGWPPGPRFPTGQPPQHPTVRLAELLP